MGIQCLYMVLLTLNFIFRNRKILFWKLWKVSEPLWTWNKIGTQTPRTVSTSTWNHVYIHYHLHSCVVCTNALPTDNLYPQTVILNGHFLTHKALLRGWAIFWFLIRSDYSCENIETDIRHDIFSDLKVLITLNLFDPFDILLYAIL